MNVVFTELDVYIVRGFKPNTSYQCLKNILRIACRGS